MICFGFFKIGAMMSSQNNQGRMWISLEGGIHTETPRQEELVQSFMFKAGLQIYKDALQKGMRTAPNRRMALNQALQKAYDEDMAQELESTAALCR